MLEKKRQKNIIDYINLSPNSFVVKVHGSALSRRGLPDLIGSYRGTPFAVEIKQPGNYPSKLQRKWLDKFKAGGYVTGIVRYIEDFINLDWQLDSKQKIE
jgi:hypothetical protein